MLVDRPLKLPPPPFVMLTVCFAGLWPPITALKDKLEAESEIWGR